ncbi:hypothetical protein BGZ65_008977, partial [Modicella reniformis]
KGYRKSHQHIDPPVKPDPDDGPESIVREVHRSDEVRGDDPLDLILDKTHGFTVVRILMTCFLDGIGDLSKDIKKSKKSEAKGRRAETANAKQAQELARWIYAELVGLRA